MRKLIYVLTLLVFFSTACNTKLDVANKSVKVFVRCCKCFQQPSKKLLVKESEVQDKGKQDEIVAPLPAYSWDSKMMFY